ncbi:MAG: tyrosine-type recombinase/integrase [Lentimicrobiaceae bacterium]|jgi:integrase/recombinase XerC|nr:tyrosine-type recombinase/integrase [Lentimicrobiaceae bacterium]
MSLLEDFIRYIQSEKRYSSHTVEAYLRDLIHLSEYLSSVYELDDFKQINTNILRSYIVSLKEQEFKNKSINRKLSSLRSFYKFLLREKQIYSDPFIGIKSLKQPQNIAKFIPINDINKITFDTESETFETCRTQLIFEILYQTGIRQNELRNLKDTDIDFGNAHIKVLGKRNKERIIPVSKVLLEYVKKYQKQRDTLFENFDNFLLLSNKGNQISKTLIYNTIRDTLQHQTTLKQKSPHILRHTCATHLLNEGADLLSIQKMLGHNSLQSTQIYTHNTIEQLKKIHKQAHPKG